MAILDKVEITITSGGKVLQEYDVEADEVAAIKEESSYKESSHVVKYIEAIPGAEFQLNYTLKENFSFGQANYTRFETKIDGKRLFKVVIEAERYHRAGTYTSTRSGAHSRGDARWEERPLYWKDLLITEEKPDATPAEMKKKYAQLGMIQVIVSRKLGSIRKDCKKGIKITLSDEPIPEKALKGKAIDSTMGLGTPRPIRRRRAHEGVEIDSCPLAVFIFQYRSKIALQMLGILPRTPEPVPLEARDPDSLTLEEARELLRRQMAEREATRVKIKQEKAEDNLRRLAAIQIKREAADMYVDEDEGISIVEPAEKKPRCEPEVIDLSD